MSDILPQEMKELKRAIVTRFTLFPFLLGVCILLPAGTFTYWEAYVYIGVLLLSASMVVHYFLKKDPGFLQRRMKMKEKDKGQKMLVILMTPVYLLIFVIPGLDQRFGWSVVPAYLVILADLAVLFGYFLVFSVFKENSYASRVIEVDENQTVITTGLYGIIRHPMYLGVLIMFLLTPLALGSYWGLIPAAAFLPAGLVVRILGEEKILSGELKGYREYCQRVKFRLIPYIW